MSERTETLTQVTAPSFERDGPYVDWSSILVGAVVATGIAFVFTTFGAAIGMTMISPYDGEGSALAALVAVGSWMLWTTISSFMTGGYIAGRMRRRVEHTRADEVSIRDGIHGLAVWGVAVLLGAFLLGVSADTAVQATADRAGSITAVMQADTAQVGGAVTDATTPAQTDGAVMANGAEAKAALETARKYSVISAFVLAAALMIAGASAYWAAEMGGRHRDEERVFSGFGPWT